MQTKQVKTSDLIGPALEWAVAILETRYKGGAKRVQIINGAVFIAPSSKFHTPRWVGYSTDWAQGGPIIEREGITVSKEEGCWYAYFRDNLFNYDGSECCQTGPSPLIAAMRCYVASKLGDVVEVPIELL